MWKKIVCMGLFCVTPMLFSYPIEKPSENPPFVKTIFPDPESTFEDLYEAFASAQTIALADFKTIFVAHTDFLGIVYRDQKKDPFTIATQNYVVNTKGAPVKNASTYRKFPYTQATFETFLTDVLNLLKKTTPGANPSFLYPLIDSQNNVDFLNEAGTFVFKFGRQGSGRRPFVEIKVTMNINPLFDAWDIVGMDVIEYTQSVK